MVLLAAAFERALGARADLQPASRSAESARAMPLGVRRNAREQSATSDDTAERCASFFSSGGELESLARVTAALHALRSGLAGFSPPHTSCGPAPFRVVRENVRADLSGGTSTRIDFPELLTSVRKASDAVRSGASAERRL